jgi:hypothetical protein
MMSCQIRQISLTQAERKELRRRIRQAKDRRTADRLRVIWLKGRLPPSRDCLSSSNEHQCCHAVFAALSSRRS